MRGTPVILTVCLVILAIVCPAGAEDADRAVIDSLMERLAESWNKGDTDGVTSCYAGSAARLCDRNVARLQSIVGYQDRMEVTIEPETMIVQGDICELLAFRTFLIAMNGSESILAEWVDYELIRSGPDWLIQSESVRTYLSTEETNLSTYIDPRHGSVSATAQIRLRITKGGERSVVLNLNASLTVSNVMRAAGEPLEFERKSGKVIIRYPEPFDAGQELQIIMRYSGAVTSPNPDAGYQQVSIGKPVSYASWVTGWYPRVDHGRAKAPGTLVFNVPEKDTVIASGVRLKETVAGDRKTVVFSAREPMDYSFATGRFFTVESSSGSVRVGVSLLDKDEDRAAFYLDRTTTLLDYLVSEYGMFPYPSFWVVELPDSLAGSMGGSCEQGLAFFPSGMLQPGDFNVILFGHEIGHSWWGNYVQSLGLSIIDEGLAHFTSGLCVEHYLGRDTFRHALLEGLPDFPQSAFFYFTLQAERNHRDYPLGVSYGNWLAMRILSQTKGQFVYNMLRDLIGREAFMGGLRRVLQEKANQQIGLADLMNAWETESGVDLQWFFQQWFYRNGAPDLSLTYTVSESGDEYRVDGSILQVSEPYRLPVEILLEGPDGRDLRQLDLVSKEEFFAFTVPFRPVTVILDPDYKILRWTDEYRNLDMLGDALLLHHLGHSSDAIELYHEFLESHPDNWRAHYFVANTYFVLGDFEQARQHYENLTLRPDPVVALERNLSMTFLRLGRVYEALNQPDLALQAYASALKHPGVAGSHRFAEYFLSLLKEKLDPGNREEVPNLAVVWRNRWYYPYFH